MENNGVRFREEVTEFENFKRPQYNRRIDYRYRPGGQSTHCGKFIGANEISFVCPLHKRPFHVQHGDGFGTPSQEPKRINIFRTAVGEDSLFSILEPLIRKVVREEAECAISKNFPSSSSSSVLVAETTSDGCNLQLLFDSKLPKRIFTNNPLKDEDGKPLKIKLYDANSKTLVESGPLSSAKVDFVVLSGLFASDREDWTEEEFNSKILCEREGKRRLLAGPQSIVLKNGVGLISDLSITDNSSWMANKMFILGAKISPKSSGKQRVKPARSRPFSVRDSRGEGYTKHYPPSSHDEVWRLEKIRKDGKYHEQLASNNILTVGDFLMLNEMNQPKLRHILGLSDKMWRKVLNHAKTCIMDDCTVSKYPNGCDGALVEDLNQPAYLNRFDEQPANRLALTYQQAGPFIPPNLGLQPLEPCIVHPQDDLLIHAPTTNNDNSEGDGTPSIFQIQNDLDRVFHPTLQPGYHVEDFHFLPQTPFYFPPQATLEHGNDRPSSSYTTEAGGRGIFPSYLDHGANILNGAD